jgi:hypothetical protein
MQENSIMIGKNLNLSYVLLIDVEEPHSFVVSLNGEDSQHWKKAMDFKFQSLQDNKI